MTSDLQDLEGGPFDPNRKQPAPLREPAGGDAEDKRPFPELRDLCGELEDRSVWADKISIMYVREMLEPAVAAAEAKMEKLVAEAEQRGRASAGKQP